MIVCTRAEARDFKLLLSRCVSGRSRGPAPPLVVRVNGHERSVTATTPDGVTLSLTTPAPGEPDDVLIVPAAVLAEVEGATDEPVSVERQSKLRGVVRWVAQGKPRSQPIDLILPGQQHEPMATPALTPVPAKFLTALHECGRTAARESGRYALSRVQLRGKAGRVIGTDGKVALLWDGWKLPFPDDVLVPALPVFGSKPLARCEEVRVGRTATHLVVVAGRWSVALPVDTRAKFPDVAAVVPRHAPTTAGIDERDAAALLPLLPELPGSAHEHRPVTLDADGVVRVRGRDDATGETREVTLIRSPTAGPPARVVLDRRVLARALSLGCHTLRLAPDKPVAAEGDGFTLVAAPLDPTLIAPPSDDSARVSTDEETQNPPTHPNNTERRTDVKPTETNGHSPSGRHNPPSPGEPPDPLVAAEELRAALADVLAKASRLIAALKHSRKEKKALSAVWAGLKQLNLGGQP
jgi:hypothetical protein